jgi:uncharacterized membrane protein YebE (DUF533 family)
VLTVAEFTARMPPRLDTLSRRQLLTTAADATEAAKGSQIGMHDKAALWALAAALLNERSGKTMLGLTWVIAALTAVVTVATVYQVAGAKCARTVAAVVVATLAGYVGGYITRRKS